MCGFENRAHLVGSEGAGGGHSVHGDVQSCGRLVAVFRGEHAAQKVGAAAGKGRGGCGGPQNCCDCKSMDDWAHRYSPVLRGLGDDERRCGGGNRAGDGCQKNESFGGERLDHDGLPLGFVVVFVSTVLDLASLIGGVRDGDHALVAAGLLASNISCVCAGLTFTAAGRPPSSEVAMAGSATVAATSVAARRVASTTPCRVRGSGKRFTTNPCTCKERRPAYRRRWG